MRRTGNGGGAGRDGRGQGRRSPQREGTDAFLGRGHHRISRGGWPLPIGKPATRRLCLIAGVRLQVLRWKRRHVRVLVRRDTASAQGRHARRSPGRARAMGRSWGVPRGRGRGGALRIRRLVRPTGRWHVRTRQLPSLLGLPWRGLSWLGRVRLPRHQVRAVRRRPHWLQGRRGQPHARIRCGPPCRRHRVVWIGFVAFLGHFPQSRPHTILHMPRRLGKRFLAKRTGPRSCPVPDVRLSCRRAETPKSSAGGSSCL